MDLIPNDWKHITTLNWNFSKTISKTFCYINEGTRKIKDLQKLSKKEILQQTFQIYISWPNFMDGRKPYFQAWYLEKNFHWLVYQSLWLVYQMLWWLYFFCLVYIYSFSSP